MESLSQDWDPQVLPCPYSSNFHNSRIPRPHGHCWLAARRGRETPAPPGAPELPVVSALQGVPAAKQASIFYSYPRLTVMPFHQPLPVLQTNKWHSLRAKLTHNLSLSATGDESGLSMHTRGFLQSLTDGQLLFQQYLCTKFFLRDHSCICMSTAQKETPTLLQFLHIQIPRGKK